MKRNTGLEWIDEDFKGFLMKMATFARHTETYSEPCQTSKMERIAKSVRFSAGLFPLFALFLYIE